MMPIRRGLSAWPIPAAHWFLHLLICLLCGFAGNAFAVRATDAGWLAEEIPGDVPGAVRNGIDADLFREIEDVPSTPGAGGEPLDRRLHRELGEAGVSEDKHPLLAIARQMRDVQVRLARQGVDRNTTAMQEQIVAQLGTLLEQARNQTPASGESARQAPPAAHRQPSSESNDQAGGNDREPRQAAAREATDEPGSGDSIETPTDQQRSRYAMERLWNQLPERQREQLLQLAPERFLPKYESQIEQYFRRLAQDRKR